MGKPKKLTPKQERFVRIMAEGKKNATDAVIEAGYNVANRPSAQQLGTQMMNTPHIRSKITELIELEFPDITHKSAETLYKILMNPESRDETKIKVVELIAKFFGWHAPQKHASIQVSVKDRLKLPGQEGDNDAT
jgi:phage terminase small subunit